MRKTWASNRQGRSWQAVLLRILCCLMLGVGAAEAAEVYPSDAVKAAFLYRFAGFIAWPPVESGNSRFVIATWGADRVADELQRDLPMLSIANHPVELRRVHDLRSLAQAQLVFFGSGHRAELRRASAAMAGSPVLLVSDDEFGLEDGSAINMLAIERRIRFEISMTALQRNGLKASSELLLHAVRVQAPGAIVNQMGESP
jgi:YfiR/HmsC-like